MQLQKKGMQYFPEPSKKHGGDTRLVAVLDKAIEGRLSSIGELLEPCKKSPGAYFCACFKSNCQKYAP